MPAIPQLIAAVFLGILICYHVRQAARSIDQVIRDYGWRYAGRPAARASAASLLSTVVPILWVMLLGWGGFWS